MPEPQSGALATSPYPPHWQGWQDSNPRHAVLETAVLPAELHPCVMRFYLFRWEPRCAVVVEGVGFEPTKATPTDLQSAPVDRFGTPPHRGAGDRNRTRDLLITSQLLYLLSYAGRFGHGIPDPLRASTHPCFTMQSSLVYTLRPSFCNPPPCGGKSYCTTSSLPAQDLSQASPPITRQFLFR